MDEVRIARTGAPPLAFFGVIVAESTGRNTAGQEHNRWHDLTIYRTAGGQYVCRVDYHTQWQGELGHTEAEQVAADEIANWFRAYSPTDQVQGFPARPEYADRQEHLLEWIRRRYDAQVGELLAKLGDLAAETID